MRPSVAASTDSSKNFCTKHASQHSVSGKRRRWSKRNHLYSVAHNFMRGIELVVNWRSCITALLDFYFACSNKLVITRCLFATNDLTRFKIPCTATAWYLRQNCSRWSMQGIKIAALDQNCSRWSKLQQVINTTSNSVKTCTGRGLTIIGTGQQQVWAFCMTFVLLLSRWSVWPTAPLV